MNEIRVFGIDFTSSPRKSKPITCCDCIFNGSALVFQNLVTADNFHEFEGWLKADGPRLIGIDFPFSLPRRFLENVGWPLSWRKYVEIVEKLERSEFRKFLDLYRKNRPVGDKEHLRNTDRVFGGVSPQKLYGVPVGLMFFEGAPRLLLSGANIPFLLPQNDNRTILEAYPGALVRWLMGRLSYKNDQRKKQTLAHQQARELIFRKLVSREVQAHLGFVVHAPKELTQDPSGDELDALLCAVQAAYAWTRREKKFGAPDDVDPSEGWIAGPVPG